MSSDAGVSPESLRKLKAKVNDTIDHLISSLQAHAGKKESDTSSLDQVIQDASLTLLQLDQEVLQRQAQSDALYDKAWRDQQIHQQRLEGCHYQIHHLQRQIQRCQNFATPHLQQLVRQQQPPPPTDGKEETSVAAATTATPVDDESAWKHFFPQPDNHTSILQTLQEELNARQDLHQQVQKQQQALEALQADIRSKEQFLSSLPNHLATMERLSKPLQKLVLGNTITTTPNDTPLLIGTKRKARLQAAKDLPIPLYTLFQTLQHYVDHQPQPTTTSSSSKSKKDDDKVLSLSILGDASSESTNHPQHVVLHIPVGTPIHPTLQPSNAKRVSLHFYYDTTAHVVTAVITNSQSFLYQDVVLQELFPHDSPAPVPSDNKKTTSLHTMSSLQKARPYHWCNYLAGIYRADGQDSVDASTRVVVRELQRRIKANTTLKVLLHSLLRNRVPPMPVVQSKDDGETTIDLVNPSTKNCKLVGFEAESEDDTQVERSFVVRLQSNNAPSSVTLTFRVKIHMARYPAIPPVWSLQPQQEQGQTDNNDTVESVLYDDRLAQLEQHVNFGLLKDNQMQRNLHECILLRQLYELLESLASLHVEEEGMGGRKRKGRDRVAIETDQEATTVAKRQKR